MPYKDAKKTLTQEEFSKLTATETGALITEYVSVEKAKAALVQLFSEGKIRLEGSEGAKTLYDLTHGRVKVDGVATASVTTAGVKSA